MDEEKIRKREIKENRGRSEEVGEREGEINKETGAQKRGKERISKRKKERSGWEKVKGEREKEPNRKTGGFRRGRFRACVCVCVCVCVDETHRVYNPQTAP